MSAFNTSTILLLAVASVIITAKVTEAVRVVPCDHVCGSIRLETESSCCRAHGYYGLSSCKSGRMFCNIVLNQFPH